MKDGDLHMGHSGNMAFKLPLWLRTNCLGRTLWAYNHEHLSRMREIVGADLRVSARNSGHATSNGSIYSSLPAWMLKPSHRETVLKAIDSIASK